MKESEHPSCLVWVTGKTVIVTEDTEKLGRVEDLKEILVSIYINCMLEIIQIEMCFK